MIPLVNWNPYYRMYKIVQKSETHCLCRMMFNAKQLSSSLSTTIQSTHNHPANHKTIRKLLDIKRGIQMLRVYV